jgi:hypothetical protein
MSFFDVSSIDFFFFFFFEKAKFIKGNKRHKKYQSFQKRYKTILHETGSKLKGVQTPAGQKQQN